MTLKANAFTPDLPCKSDTLVKNDKSMQAKQHYSQVKLAAGYSADQLVQKNLNPGTVNFNR
ncbi:hypothetical protein [Nitrincola sp. MINF-07-Sa-05]|uniref:hypothetical protein n=1 Tax=Nitrincola salilacus TaxID=3400273 RepID=UPI003917C1BF